MATDSGKKSFSGVFGSVQTPEEVRRRFIEAPLDASVPAALGSVLELGKVLTRLPDVFIASQNKELERLKASVGESDPRIEALQASIDRAKEWRTTAQKGQVRVQRAAVTVASGKKVFHGFVSKADLTPMAGVTVRLSDRKADGVKGAATTDNDGYFSMALGPTEFAAPDTKRRDLTLSQRINQLFETRKLDTSNASETATDASKKEQTRVSTVQILRKRKLLYEDPIPLETDDGTVYREYIVSEDGSSEVDRNEYASGISWEDAGRAPDAKDTDASKTGSRTRKKAPKK